MNKEQKDLNIASLAIAGVRFLTPLLLSVLAYTALDAKNTLDKMVIQMQEIRISMASDGAEKQELKRMLTDHEARLRLIEQGRK